MSIADACVKKTLLIRERGRREKTREQKGRVEGSLSIDFYDGTAV